jgi:hypothetical protein
MLARGREVLEWTLGDAAPVRLIAHSDGKEFGTAFAVYADQEATWLVTCAHVVDQPRNGATFSVGGRPAVLVANGREEGRAKKIDLAVLRVSGLQGAQVLPLGALTGHRPDCLLPGWFKHAEGSYRSDCLDASVGRPFSWTEPGSSLIAQAYELAMGQERRLAKGYSGAPAICSETGEVFAVVATKEEPSTSGSAICIEYLLEIWPDMPAELRAALAPSELGAQFDQDIRDILGAFADTVSAQEIRAVCARSIPAELNLSPPAEESPEGYAGWLLDRPRFVQNGRHPLYDVLAYFKPRAGADELLARRVARAMHQLARHHPGLVTDPLPAPRHELEPEPALVEIVFEPRTSAEVAAYDVHSFWHRPSGAGVQAGPRREHGDGGRLDLRSDPEVADFACELLQARDAWNVGAEEIVFLFRLPNELLLHPFEHWPQDVLLNIPLGRDYPVVVGLRERPLATSRQLWERLSAHLGERLRDHLWCADADIADRDRVVIAQVLARIEQAACPVLTKVPELAGANLITLLTLLVRRGVPVALWPRSEEAAKHFCKVMVQSLGGEILGRLPLAVRDLRRKSYGANAPHPAHEHLTLLWDDPTRSATSARSEQFFTGVF